MFNKLQEDAAVKSLAPRYQNGKAVNPSISATQQAAIGELLECIEIADALLAKMRGSLPRSTDKAPEDAPSVMGSAMRINCLASAVILRLKELHEVIGE